MSGAPDILRMIAGYHQAHGSLRPLEADDLTAAADRIEALEAERDELRGERDRYRDEAESWVRLTVTADSKVDTATDLIARLLLIVLVDNDLVGESDQMLAYDEDDLYRTVEEAGDFWEHQTPTVNAQMADGYQAERNLRLALTRVAQGLAGRLAQVDLMAAACEFMEDDRAALNAALGQSYGPDGAWDSDHPYSVLIAEEPDTEPIASRGDPAVDHGPEHHYIGGARWCYGCGALPTHPVHAIGARPASTPSENGAGQ